MEITKEYLINFVNKNYYKFESFKKLIELIEHSEIKKNDENWNDILFANIKFTYFEFVRDAYIYLIENNISDFEEAVNGWCVYNVIDIANYYMVENLENDTYLLNELVNKEIEKRGKH